MHKIVLFIGSLSSGGAEHQIIELAKLLLAKGYDITLVTYADISDHYYLPHNINRIRLAENKSKIIKLFHIFIFFISVKTDCVISFEQRNNVLSLIPLLFRKKIKKIMGERNVTIGKPDIFEKILFGFLYNYSDWIVPNSRTQGKYIEDKYPKLSKKVFVITNFTDLNNFTFAEYVTNVPIKIGVFSRYAPQKNCMRFVEAIKRVTEKSKVQFIVEWYGNIHLKEGVYNPFYLKMQERINYYNLNHIIKLNNHVKDVKTRLVSFDVVALPSLYEGFSNSISEAICCGRPMLVSNVSENSYMVKDKENGYLFDPTSTEDISNAIVKFLHSDDETRYQMSCKSRQIAENIFDSDNYVNNYINLIES